MDTRLIRGSPQAHALIAQHAADRGGTMTRALDDLLQQADDSKGASSGHVAGTVAKPVSDGDTGGQLAPAPANGQSIQERPVEVDHAPKVDQQAGGLFDPHALHAAVAREVVKQYHDLGHSVASMAERLEDIEDVADDADVKADIALHGLSLHLAGHKSGEIDADAEQQVLIEALNAEGQGDCAQSVQAYYGRLLAAPNDEQAKADNAGKPKLLPKTS